MLGPVPVSVCFPVPSRARARRSPGRDEYRKLPKTPILDYWPVPSCCMVDPAAPAGTTAGKVEPVWLPAAGKEKRSSDLSCDPARGCRFCCAGRSPGHPRAGASGRVSERERAGSPRWSGAGQVCREEGSNEASEVGSPQWASGRASRMPASKPGPVKK